jgi:RND family efflux transporter MFP subunit
MTRFTAACAVALVAAACADAPAPAAREAGPPAPVTTQAAGVRDLPVVVDVGGVVRAATTAAVASRMLAPVRAVAVAAGDRVRAGDTLIMLDGRDMDAARARADAAGAALQHALAAAEAEREAARAALTLARATHGRVSALHERRSATRQELDEAAAALRTAEARAGAAEARVAETSASLQAARAEAERATVTASFAIVTAPFDGVVTETLVEAGNMASPGLPLVRVEDARRFRVEIHLDESAAAHVSPGQPIGVIVGAAGSGEETGDRVLSGRVAEVASAVEAGRHAFLVKIDLPAQAGLRSGMFARARVPAPARRSLAVPDSAVVPRGQLATVFVESGGRAQMRVLRTGHASGGWVEVLAGLVAGERVILSPPPSLGDGDAITPRSAAGGQP